MKPIEKALYGTLAALILVTAVITVRAGISIGNCVLQNKKASILGANVTCL